MPAPARQRSAWRETVAGVAFGGYALIGRLATPLVHRYLRRRLAQGREEADRFGERLGRGGVARPAGPLLWIHGASVGEAQSALPLIERLRRDWPGFDILMTSGTVTSARLMSRSEERRGGKACVST